jgi:hypothetical protein
MWKKTSKERGNRIIIIMKKIIATGNCWLNNESIFISLISCQNLKHT